MCKTAGTKSVAAFEQYSVVSFQSLTMTGGGKSVTYNPEDGSAKSIDITAGSNVSITDNSSTANALKLKISSTDTKNTTGSNNNTEKLYLIGAISQTTGTNGTQTYSNKVVYEENGALNATGFIKSGGTSSQFLKADGSVSTHSGMDKVGTVTSVAASAGGGISVSGSPITSSGTLTITNTGVRSVTAGSTANVIKVNTNGSEADITINNVAHATQATKATQDGSGNIITSTYVKKSGDTMTGTLTATSFVKSEGTATQFLMANGTTKTLAAGSNITLTQASGSTTISVSGALSAATSTTHAALVRSRIANTLVPGQWYRITDYNPTFVTTYEETANYLHSGGHRFDILVMATSNKTLASDAYACRHDDRDTYFANCDIEKWRLKYALTDPYEDLGFGFKKYDWCNATTDGGIIYEMIDENGNECPYDFKNVMIKVISSFRAGYNNDIYNVNSFGSRYGGAGEWFYTFSLFDNKTGTVKDLSVELMTKANRNFCHYFGNNVIKPFNLNMVMDSSNRETPYKVQQHLNSIVLEQYCTDSSKMTDVTGSPVMVQIYDNYFDYNCSKIFMLTSKTSVEFNSNHFKDFCSNIICIDRAVSCTIDYGTSACLFYKEGNSVNRRYIHIGANCNGILVSKSESSSIGKGSERITLAGNRNNIGNGGSKICLNENCNNNVIEDACFYIYLKNGAVNNHIGTGCENIGLFTGGNNTFGQGCENISTSENSSRTSIPTGNPETLAVRPMYDCTFKSGCKNINLSVDAGGTIRRMHVFSSASGYNSSNITNISCTSKPTDAPGNFPIDECVARTSATGTLVIKSPCY